MKLSEVVQKQQAANARIEATALAPAASVPLGPRVVNADEVVDALGAHPQLVYIDQIQLDPGQPRKVSSPPTSADIETFDPMSEAGDDEVKADPHRIRALARTIHIHGLLNPLVIEKHRGRFRLVAGERRYWACRLLGWDQVPAVVWNQMTPVHRTALQVIENLQREDLSKDEKKVVFLQLREELDGNAQEVCRLLGIHRSTFFRIVGDEGKAAPVRRVSTGQLVKAIEAAKDKVTNMSPRDRQRVHKAASELLESLDGYVLTEDTRALQIAS